VLLYLFSSLAGSHSSSRPPQPRPLSPPTCPRPSPPVPCAPSRSPTSRHDYSTAPSGFFYRGKAINDTAAGLANSQHTIIFNFIGYFERRFAGLHG